MLIIFKEIINVPMSPLAMRPVRPSCTVESIQNKLNILIDITKDEDDESVKAKAMKLENVIKFTEGKEIVKTIVIKNKIINIVVK